MLIGASGICTITLPPPTEDYEELPYALIATTTTLIFIPSVRLNGATVKTLSGIVHYVVEIIDANAPSQ